MKKTIGYLSFTLLIILSIVMAWATWEEHSNGTAYAVDAFYGSTWFTLLWAWLAITGGYYILKTGLYKKKAVFLLHLSLLIILLGAITTRFNGKTGMIHLKENVENNRFNGEEIHHGANLPFYLSLKSFRIDYYPGTSSPANYVSIVEVRDKEANKTFEQEISMNNILKYKGYRFYQSSFDDDMKGSILSVNHDVWGIRLTYAGYYLLFFSMIWVLFDRRGRFLELIKKLSAV